MVLVVKVVGSGVEDVGETLFHWDDVSWKAVMVMLMEVRKIR